MATEDAKNTPSQEQMPDKGRRDTLKTLARLVGCWCAGRTVQTALMDCSISKFTVTKYYQEFRQVAEALYRKDISSNPLGNTGGIIQIDKSHFF